MRLTCAVAFLFLASQLSAQDKPPTADNSILVEIAKRSGAYPPRKPSGNAIAEKKFANEFKDYLGQVVGKKVTWKASIQRVTEKLIFVNPPAIPREPAERDFQAQFARFYLYLNPGDVRNSPVMGDKTRTDYIPIPKDVTVMDLENITPGDSLTLTGEIVEIQERSPPSDGFPRVGPQGTPFCVVLKNVAIQLPKQSK